MKRSIFLIAIALMISTGIMAQNTDQSQPQSQNNTQVQSQSQNQKQSRNQTKVQDGKQVKDQTRNEASEHGQAVSSTAKNTDPGTGKGKIVSQQAKSRGETQKARIHENNSAKNKNANRNKSARSKSIQPNNIRMPNEAGSGRK